MPNGTGIMDGDTSLTDKLEGIVVNDKANKGYNGESDEWKLPVIATEYATIFEGERIAQFEIVPTMDAPWWVWIKWMFKRKIKIEFVDTMLSHNRSGFGSTNK